MKKTIYIALAALGLMAQPAVADDEEMCLCIYTEQGDEYVCQLSQQPKLMREDKALKLVSRDGTQTLVWDDVVEFVFGLPDGVHAVRRTVSMAIDGGVLRLSGIKAGSMVTVAGMNGVQAVVAKAQADGTLAVNLDALARGVWVVRTSGGSFKFVKKQ